MLRISITVAGDIASGKSLAIRKIKEALEQDNWCVIEDNTVSPYATKLLEKHVPKLAYISEFRTKPGDDNG